MQIHSPRGLLQGMRCIESGREQVVRNKSDGGDYPRQLEAGLAGGSLAVCPGHAVRPGHVPGLAGWPNQPLS